MTKKSEERCERTDLLVTSCAHCLGHDKAEVAEWAAGAPFAAHYPGTCARCSESFDSGDIIAHVPDDDVYVHATCAQGEPPIRANWWSVT